MCRLGSGATLLLGLALVASPPGAAQRTEDPVLDAFGGDLRPAAPRVPPPRLVLRVTDELPVPGPLVGTGPRRDGLRLLVDVAEGVAHVEPGGNAPAVVLPAAAPPGSDPPAAISSDGRFRARFAPSGELILERRSRRAAERWRRRWKLRVPGLHLAAPLVTERRVFFGGADNVIYCLKRSNGHRVWEHDAEGRILHGLSLWTGGAADPALAVRLVLAVTDNPARLLALDSRTGAEVTSFELGEQQSVVGVPLVLPEGRIVIGRQDYEPTEARLVVLEIVPALPESAAAVPASRPGAAQER